MSWDPKVPPIMSTLGKEREEKRKQKEKDAEKTPLKPEEAKRDENYFKKQKMRQLQQENIEIAAEQQRRRYRRISDYSEHLDIPQDEQEEFKVNIEELLRDKEIVLDTIAEQQKQIASMMEDAKRIKEKLKIHKGRETALDIEVQKMINDAKQKEEYHERQIAVMKEEMRLENARRIEDARVMREEMREEMRLENARRIEDHRRIKDAHQRQMERIEDAHQRQIAGMKEEIAGLKEEIAGLKEETRLENSRRIEDDRRVEDAHQRQIASMKEDMRRLEGKQREQSFGCMY